MTTIDKVLENQRAWQALSADDESASSAMALRSLSKCADAIAVLSENLRSMGYFWISSQHLPADALERNSQTIEAKTGLSIPKVLLGFWGATGGISFVDLENYRHKDFWTENKILAPKGFADGLHVYACDDQWASFICRDYAEWKDDEGQEKAENFLLSLSPDGYHKDNISGGAPYGIFTESSWKPIWRNFEWSGMAHPVSALEDPPDFLSYLRTVILECAGFPALLGVPAFDRIREKLLQDVPLF
jgi:hypothetical protein